MYRTKNIFAPNGSLCIKKRFVIKNCEKHNPLLYKSVKNSYSDSLKKRVVRRMYFVSHSHVCQTCKSDRDGNIKSFLCISAIII